MSRKPPAARMRQIRRNFRRNSTTPSIPEVSGAPANVEEALGSVTEPAEVVPVETPEIRVQVGFVEAVVTPGLDGVFATPDDQVKLNVQSALDEPEFLGGDLASSTDLMVEAVVEPVEVPGYSADLKKDELKALAIQFGLDDSGTKAEIVERLNQHFGR